VLHTPDVNGNEQIGIDIFLRGLPYGIKENDFRRNRVAVQAIERIFLASTTHSHSTRIVDPPKGVVSGSTAYNPSSNAA